MNTAQVDSPLVSEDDYHTGSQTLSHQQQSFWRLLSPGESHKTNRKYYCYWCSKLNSIMLPLALLVHSFLPLFRVLILPQLIQQGRPPGCGSGGWMKCNSRPDPHPLVSCTFSDFLRGFTSVFGQVQYITLPLGPCRNGPKSTSSHQWQLRLSLTRPNRDHKQNTWISSLCNLVLV